MNTTTGRTNRPLNVAGRMVPMGVLATQVRMTGRGPARYSISIPGYGRRFIAVSAIN